jgi:aryl-alcohol dehydrogenase-like predicted oxidoreductase
VSAERQQQIEELRDATDKLIEATHVGEPWQVSSAQRAWDEALDALAARLSGLQDEVERAARIYEVCHENRMKETARADAAEFRLSGLQDTLAAVWQAAQAQYGEWMHFHETAMDDPFKAESQAQEFCRKIAALALTGDGARDTTEETTDV